MTEINSSVEDIVNEAIRTFSPIYLEEEDYQQVLLQCEPYPYLTSENGICILSKKKSGNKEGSECKIQPIASYVKVIHKLHNLDTEEIRVALEIDNGVSRIQKEFSRTILSKMEIRGLLTYGVKFVENYSDCLIRYLIMTEGKADTLHIHSSLGWSKIHNTPIFKCSEIIFPHKCKMKFHSSYRGNLDLQSHGSLTAWLSMIKSQVIGNLPMTVALLLAFASPILAFVTQKFDLGSLLFSISNESSKGKTTSGALITSVFSNPCLNKGTMRTFNATQNFIVSFLSQTSGLPVVFDEASEFSGDLEQLVYLLTSGCEKGRLDSNSEMRDEKSWRSIIISTSEINLLTDTSPNGLKARCFTIPDQLTKDADNADTIKTTVSSNYGVAGTAYLLWILDHKMNCLENDYLAAKNLLIQETSNSEREPSPLTYRILSKLAVVIVAAQYVSECFDLKLNFEAIQGYLLKIEKTTSQKTDFAMDSLDVILQEISKNSAKYLTSNKIWCDNAVGKITEEKDYKIIDILKIEFLAYCAKNKLHNSHQVLIKLKERGILQCENDRLTKRVRLNEHISVQTCYEFKISDVLCTRQGLSSGQMTQISKDKQLIPIDSQDDDINF